MRIITFYDPAAASIGKALEPYEHRCRVQAINLYMHRIDERLCDELKRIMAHGLIGSWANHFEMLN